MLTAFTYLPLQKSTPAMASIYQAPLLLPSKLLSEGLSNIGDNRRLERTLWKLIKGVSHCTVEAVSPACLGGPSNYRRRNLLDS